MKRFDVTALGEILIDFTPAGKSKNGRTLFEENPGCAPANAAAAAAKLGARAAFIGKTGDDQFGRDAKAALENCGVYTGAMKTDKRHTTLAFVTLAHSGERAFSFARSDGADINLSADDIDEKLINDSTFLHIGSLSCTDEPSLSATHKAIDCAKNGGIFISYDPNWREPLWRDKEEGIETMRSLFKYADFVKIADNELALMYGENTPIAAQEILDEGAKLVCVTLGKDGVFYKTQGYEGIVSIPQYNIEVRDTTGAGDAFTGALLYRLTRRENPFSFTEDELKCDLHFANAAATLCVSRYGAIPALASLSETEKLLASFPGISGKQP
ncbi:carbohydrate kinase, PfkB family [Treponema socranskii subsp. socranskii VPI DR56BR1116 = ATCC 35536]|uniref:Carbohydrate kinase, PfkB family n=1 Tax=Treponema socranskii subsp. socranskii VPI DR56BR1116 = ATCC 35536 TaxID=1125725 RepID=A0ABN0P240_TRESO|nr:carbohydrate kinase [Treponema socranskii]ERJ97637.1 carbohydrate kinase, PfkB family [Treponema socranskii subsp. socranskii VPI DR56BR1116 = ATCC 35536]